MAEEDMIFGKNRHFFGGMEPSNMALFTVAVEEGAVKISTQLPGDTVVDGQTLCTVAGAVIRRKSTGYPKDEFDGDLVANITASASIIDTNADIASTYFYRAFPYSTRGVYNRNVANKAVINEPDPMVEFEAKSVYTSSTGGASVQITAKLPDAAAGAIIRKSTVGYPVDETDGEEFMTITEDGVYIDSNVVMGTTYYYSAFPYNSVGAYNMSDANKSYVIINKYGYLFGFDLDTTNSDPDTRVTYPDGVDNATYTPAYMDFSTGTFNYGSWPNTPGEKFMPKPCMLTYAGVVDHYLDPNDYTKRENSSTASSVANTSFGGNAMMEWSKIYTKRWEENGIYHFRCCDIKLDDDYECWSNYDINNNEIDHFYTRIYNPSLVSNKIRSISGQSLTYSRTWADEISYATANGDGWYVEVLADHLLIQDLLVMMAKSTDGQTAYGNGVCDNSSVLKPGTMNAKGLFWGDDNYTSGVKVFGMEHMWGNVYRRIAGWVNNNGTQKVKLTRGTYDGSTATDYNTDGSGYLVLDSATPSGTSGGYIKTMKVTPYGRIPVKIGGSSTTYEADALYYYNDSNYVYCAMVGGAYSSTNATVGPFTTNLQDYAARKPSSANTGLSCKPSTN